MEIVEGPCLAAMSCGKPAYLVVLLDHPGAADARLIDIAINWQPAMLKADFLLAEAPLPGKTPGSRQWFETEGKSPDEIINGMKEAAEALNKFIDEELAKRRRMDSHLALVGFGQGADLALYVGLRRPKPMGSLVAFAGTLRSPELLAAEITSRPDMLLVQGDADPVVPFETMTKAKEALKALDVPVKSMTCKGAGHLVSDDGVMGCEAFLTKTLLKPKIKPEDYDTHDHSHDDHDHDHGHDDHAHDDHDHAHEEHDDHAHDDHDHAH